MLCFLTNLSISAKRNNYIIEIIEFNIFVYLIFSFLLAGNDIIAGDDGLLYRVANDRDVKFTTCEILCAATPGFRVPQANNSNVMAYLKTRKYFRYNHSVRSYETSFKSRDISPTVVTSSPQS